MCLSELNEEYSLKIKLSYFIRYEIFLFAIIVFDIILPLNNIAVTESSETALLFRGK